MIRYQSFDYHPRNANQLWPGNDSLAAWASANTALFAGRRVLELGTATGVLGILLAQLGAQVSVLSHGAFSPRSITTITSMYLCASPAHAAVSSR